MQEQLPNNANCAHKITKYTIKNTLINAYAEMSSLVTTLVQRIPGVKRYFLVHLI